VSWCRPGKANRQAASLLIGSPVGNVRPASGVKAGRGARRREGAGENNRALAHYRSARKSLEAYCCDWDSLDADFSDNPQCAPGDSR
jgi:hypothetical protein